MSSNLPIQLQILDSTYTEDPSGNRNFSIKIKFDVNISEKSWFQTYVQKDPTAYLQLETVQGIKTSISQQNISINWKKVIRGQVILPVNEFSFNVTGIDNLPNNIMRATVYMWSDMKPVSYTISTQKTLESQISQATIPESASIGVTGISKNYATLYWSPHSDGGSKIINYNLTIINQDMSKTIFQNTVTGNNFRIENLDSDTNYKAYIIVINEVGNSPENSIGFKTTGIKVVTPPVITPPVITPPVITPPVVVPPVEKEYDVTVLRINEFGGVYSEFFYGIKGNKLLELESQFLVVLSDKPRPTDDEVRDFYNFVDTSIDVNMVSQSIGAFTLKDGKVTGKIIYIAESVFNSYYYNKTIYSIVHIKDQSGSTIKLKTNNLNFTATERDETITINEGVGDLNAVKIEFYVSKNPDTTLPFALKKVDEIVAQEIGLKPCPIGQHRNFNNKCVSDDPPSMGSKPSIISLLGGVTALFGTLALLGSKRR